MLNTKDSGNESLGRNHTKAMTNDSDIEAIHIFGAVISALSIVMNGLLLTCIFFNRKKVWITRRRELASLIASDFVIGVIAVTVFVARKSLGESANGVLRLVEEAIYFTSKCVTINHLLLICLNGLLQLVERKGAHRAKNSFQIQCLFVWMTTLSWLVIPVLLLGNECSTFRFTKCQALANGPVLMIQFLLFIFVCPWLLTNIFYGVYLVLSLRRKYNEANVFQSISLFRRKQQREQKCLKTERSNSEWPDKCARIIKDDSFSEDAIHKLSDSSICPVHFGSFSSRQCKEEKESRNQNDSIIAIGLMLLAVDVSVLSIVMSFVSLLVDTGLDAAAYRNLYILDFINQVANPLIYILTMPSLRVILRTMSFTNIPREQKLNNGHYKEIKGRISPVLRRRFKTVSFSTNNKRCTCYCNIKRRQTIDNTISNEPEQNKKVIGRYPTRYPSDDALIRNFKGIPFCANAVRPIHESQSVDLNGSPQYLRVSSRKQSEVSGRSIISGGLSIEMESQVSISDFLACDV